MFPLCKMTPFFVFFFSLLSLLSLVLYIYLKFLVFFSRYVTSENGAKSCLHVNAEYRGKISIKFKIHDKINFKIDKISFLFVYVKSCLFN